MKTHRLRLLTEALNLSVNRFEQEIGVSQSRIARTIERDSKITVELIDKILTRFPNVNKEWLLTGHGEMFTKPSDLPKHTKPTPDKPSDNKLSPVKETDTPYKKPQSLYNIASELWDYLTSPKRSTEDVLEADEVLRKLIERAKKEKP